MEVVLPLVVVAAAVLLVLLWGVAVRNRFVVLRNRCDESWAGVGTELRRRHDLVPNLVAAVQGAARHEQRLQQAVAEARALAANRPAMDGREDPVDRARTERRLAAAVDRLLMVAEAYPDLKASRNFLELQKELAVTEDRIQAVRRFYNANVRDHRDAVRTFPRSIVASLLGERTRPFFQAEAIHALAPRVVA